jgi:hypothetical protein
VRPPEGRRTAEAVRGISLRIDADTRTADVFTAPDVSTTVPAVGTLDGGAVLPGFTLSLQRLFERAGRRRGS